jgi:hypothetical protein
LKVTTYTTWLWGDSYGEHYVKKLEAAVKRNTECSRFVCFVDKYRPLLTGSHIQQVEILDMHLTKVKGCFARLRLFDPGVQKLMGLQEGDRIVNLDLDLVVTGNLDDLFDCSDDFAILQNINTTNPCPYNGSVWTFKAGYRPDVWHDFSIENYTKYNVPYHAFPDDQGWFEYKMPNAGAYGPETGVYGFKKKGWPSGDALPSNARIVSFPGWRDPAKFTNLSWVTENWR